MKLLITLVCLYFAGFATGCISTRVSSLVDPAYRDSSYGRILVIGNYSQIEQTKMSETKMVKYLQDSGIFAVANSEILPPLRKYSDSEIALVYKKYDLDACIIMFLTGDSSEGFYTSGMTNINHGIGYGGFGTSTVTTSVTSTHGSYEKKSYVDTRAELRDIRTGSLVARCETNSEQTSYPESYLGGSAESLMSSICEKMVAEFKKNKLLRKK